MNQRIYSYVHVTISGVSACENYRGISVAAGRALSLSSLKVAPGDFGVMQANLTCVSLTPLCSGRVELSLVTKIVPFIFIYRVCRVRPVKEVQITIGPRPHT